MKKQSARRKLASDLLSRGLSSVGKTLRTPVSKLTGKQKLLGALGAGGAIAGGKLLYTSFPELSTGLQKALDQYQVGKALSEVKNYKDYLGKPVAEETAHFLNNVIRAGSKDPASLSSLNDRLIQNADDTYRQLAQIIEDRTSYGGGQEDEIAKILSDTSFPGELSGNHYKYSPEGQAYLRGASREPADIFLGKADDMNRLTEELPSLLNRIQGSTRHLLSGAERTQGEIVSLLGKSDNTVERQALETDLSRFLRQRGTGGLTLPYDSDVVPRAQKLYQDIAGANKQMASYISDSVGLQRDADELAQVVRDAGGKARDLKLVQEYLNNIVNQNR